MLKKENLVMLDHLDCKYLLLISEMSSKSTHGVLHKPVKLLTVSALTVVVCVFNAADVQKYTDGNLERIAKPKPVSLSCNSKSFRKNVPF